MTKAQIIENMYRPSEERIRRLALVNLIESHFLKGEATSIANALYRSGIDTIEKFLKVESGDLAKIRGIGTSRMMRLLALQETLKQTEWLS